MESVDADLGNPRWAVSAGSLNTERIRTSGAEAIASALVCVDYGYKRDAEPVARLHRQIAGLCAENVRAYVFSNSGL